MAASTSTSTPSQLVLKFEDLNLIDHLKDKGYLDKMAWTQKAASKQADGTIFDDLDSDFAYFKPMMIEVGELI